VSLRILFLSTEHAQTRGTGGIGAYVTTASEALAEMGHDVHVLSCLPGAAAADDESRGVRLHTRPLLRVRGLARVMPGAASHVRALLAMSNYWHARRLGRFDVVEAPEWQAEGLLFAVLRRHRLVTHLHTPNFVLSEFEQLPATADLRLADRMERFAARRSAVITSPSELLVRHLRDRGWLGKRQVELVRYPVDWRRFDVAAASGRPVVLCVGRIERRKAPELAVEALALLRARGVTAELVLAGRSSGYRDGLPYAEWLRQLADHCGVPCRVVGELHWPDIPQLYAGCRVVCVPSRFESFSMAAAEGMAAGAAVVLTEDVGAAELLAGADHGQVVAGAAEPLAAALAPFLQDERLAAEVGATNRSTVRAACDPATIAARRVALFLDYCGPGRRVRGKPARSNGS
jgi:glycosyltransferase involved in cell wall biosynthesis